ncbi:XRE family transcriptional regulator [Nocardia panacis]|uniref:XRE family transcriptional regulator n=1 Tax=Nocardia panacis TaxID=2340916 RepID=A0A3A4KT26_9NOCA|nr:helix-turn-helix transcriptional regulator [Nocardia panacis]RJO79295.1 XRE family transcriptional regulator [Nocardia panacis]
MDGVGSTFPRRQLGRHLRELRTSVGLTIEAAAELMQWSFAMLQRLEKGQVDKVRDVDVRELCRIYEADTGDVDMLIKLARQASVPEWWQAYEDLLPEKFDVYIGLENSAKKLVAYQSELVPGLLQTERYARTPITAGFPEQSPSEIERLVQLRIKRQSLITRSVAPLHLEVVIHESVLRTVIGSRRVMAEQLKALADASTRDNIKIQILPFDAGYPTGNQIGPFTIMDFGTGGKGRPVEPPVVYVEGFTGALYVDRPKTVQRYREAHGVLRSSALDVPASRRKLRNLVKELEREL